MSKISPEEPIKEIDNRELTPKEMENLRFRAFGYGYTPDCNRKGYILDLQKRIKDSKNPEDLNILEEIFSLIEKNDYKFNIKFLESLTDIQKKKLSSVIFKDRYSEKHNNLKSRTIIGKSIFIWIVWYGICNEPYTDKKFEELSKIITYISQNFEGLYNRLPKDSEGSDNYKLQNLYRILHKIIPRILKIFNLSKDDTVHNELLDNDTLQDFENFNPTYFMQAYSFIHKRNSGEKKSEEKNSDINIFDIVAEYNYIKNMSKDIRHIVETLSSNQYLYEKYSIRDLHAMDECGFGRDVSTGQELGEQLRLYTENKGNKGNSGENVYYIDSGGSTQNGHYEINADNTNNSGENFDYTSSVTSTGNRLNYEISTDNMDNTGKKIHYIDLETPTGIGLFYEDNPIAFISFYIRNREDLVINQIKKVPIYNCKYDRVNKQIVLGGKEFSDYTSSNGNNEYRSEVLYMAVSELAKKYNISNIKFNSDVKISDQFKQRIAETIDEKPK